MKIIITRPAEDAGPLSEKLVALGHQPIICAVLQIVPRSAITIPQRPYQAICLTSANAVRVLESIENIKSIPLLAVGPQSKHAALNKGFSNVLAEGGDVLGLHNFIVKNIQPQDGPLLYISGSETSGDLEGKLKKSGFDVDRIITYQAKPQSLAGQEHKIKSADAVVLYSPRSAKLWVDEIKRLQLETSVLRIKHICLSANVAANLPQSWLKATAETPTEMSVLALLD